MAVIEGLAASFRGEVLTPAAFGDKAARTVWNVMLDRRSAWMTRCTGTTDVIQAVTFARAPGLLMAVHTGVHLIVGTAICESRFRIDLTARRLVQVDAQARRLGSGWALW